MVGAMNFVRSIMVAALALMALSPTAHALESAPVTSARTTVTLVSETDSVAPGKDFRLGLNFKLAPGWHIYWSNPGDAGQAPVLDLTLPADTMAGPLQFPTPVRVAEGPVMTFAYLDAVTLPFTVTPPKTGGSLPIVAKASWLVCNKVCIPEEGSFQITLPAGTGTPSAEAGLFAASDARMPRPSPYQAHIASDGALSITGSGLSNTAIRDAWFFPAESGVIEQDAPQPLTVGDGALVLKLTPTHGFDPAHAIDGELVLKDAGSQEVGLTIHATPGAAPAIAASVQTSLIETLLFAFLGGLVLNLMPCVFPVLAMKAVAIARLSGAERGHVRASAVAYTAGILLAFGALAGLLLALRYAGREAGWGFQFQSPIFVVATAWLLFAVGLNLSGVYSVGTGIMGAGQGLVSKGGHLGSFFAGLLAVLVATPCTAPFMGAAIAAALAASPIVMIGIFLTMGLGLAAPYGLLAVVPGLARLLPRPGRWMDILKQFLAFPMYGATAWLVWVASQQAGSEGVLASVVGLVLLGFAFWAYGIAQYSEGIWRRVGQAGAVAAIAACLFVLSQIAPSAEAAGAPVVKEAGTKPYSADRLAALRAAGQPVFVNMTAAWCVTCLVNERVALSTSAVRDAFAADHVTYLKGDWTRQDPAITQFLRDHGRDGVPLYLFYPAGGGEPKLLPQILTAGIVLDALSTRVPTP
jgi:thiol:disulfide interchange protein DsbD